MMKIFLSLTLLMLITTSYSQSYIADYTVAKESVLRQIPQEYINKARKDFKIAYQHTSHGTHVSYGLFGLPEYKNGDEVLFAVSRNEIIENHLALYDNTIKAYAESGTDASDLSRNETAFIQATRNFLDDPTNSDINIIMWSWCDISGHQVETNYLPGMKQLIDEYSIGGSKIGNESHQRAKPVHFIFMTGHANSNDNIGNGKPKNQADLITNYCKSNQFYCLDYFSIDSHCMNDNYYPDCSDDGASNEYGGNYYKDFQNKQTDGDDYYPNKKTPNGNISFGEHNTQHVTANRKAYAMWWILARLAGWANTSTTVKPLVNDDLIHFDQSNKKLYLTDNYYVDNSICRVYSLTGSLVLEKTINSTALSFRHLKNGLYIVSVSTKHGSVTKKIVIQQ